MFRRSPRPSSASSAKASTSYSVSLVLYCLLLGSGLPEPLSSASTPAVLPAISKIEGLSYSVAKVLVGLREANLPQVEPQPLKSGNQSGLVVLLLAPLSCLPQKVPLLRLDLGLRDRFSAISLFPRKEVIQPHLPVRLPCYDFTPITDPTLDACLRFYG